MLFAVGGLVGSILISILAKKLSGKHISVLLILNSIIFLSLIIAYAGIFSEGS